MIFNHKQDGRNYRFNVKLTEKNLPTIGTIATKDGPITIQMRELFKALKHLNVVANKLELLPELIALKKLARKKSNSAAEKKDFIAKLAAFRNKGEHKWVKERIQQYKAELKNYSYMVYEVEITLGNNKKIEGYWEPPTRESIRSLIKDYISELKEKRKSAKKIAVTENEMNGIIYQTTANVFTKAGTILALQANVNNLDRISRAKAPHPCIKDNYIGVELELICNISREKLNEEFIAAKLAGYVYVKGDSSIRRENDNEHCHEVTILAKQVDYIDIVQRVCAVLNNSRVGSYVNNSCGMHVHFDARNRKHEVMYTNLVRMLPLLKQIVPTTRTEGSQAHSYCQLNKSDVFNEKDARYQAINPTSVRSHKTIEVRLHGGTTNAAKIINWIKICLCAVDSETVILPVTNLDELRTHNISSKLAAFIAKRIETFRTQSKGADTRSDHFFMNDLEVA